jgi:PAS domain S-box-containing protein
MHDPKRSGVRARNPLISGVQGARTALSLEVSDWRALLVSLRTPAGWRKAARAALPLLAYAVAWIISLHVTTVLALVLNPRIEGQDPLYIRGAVTISALLLTPPRRWWLYLLVTLPLVPLECWFLGLPNTAAVREVAFFAYVIIVVISVVTVSLIRRYLALPLRFANASDVSRFIACVAVGAVPAILIAASARAVLFSWDVWLSWQIGYLGYVLGIVIFTPAIVLWLTEGPQGLGLTSRRLQVEGGLLLLTTVVVSVVVFGAQLPDKLLADALLFALVPVLIWAALRFGPQGFASTWALVTLIAITGTVFNRGPFVGGPGTDDTVALQLSLLFVGMPLFFLAAVVQERKQDAVELLASEERYRGVVESQTELISRYLPDTTLTFVNEANCRSMGLSREQLVGTKFIDLLPESAIEPVRARIRSLLAHPGDPGVSTMEHQVRMADGTLRWQQWVDRTILDDTGQVIEIQGVGRDVTERKQMEHQLHESEARYRATFDSTAIGVAIVDLAGCPLEVNDFICRMVGYTGDELRTMSLSDFTHPDDVADNQALMRRALDEEIGSYQFEKRYMHKDGRVVWGRVSSSLVRSQDGKPMYFVTHLEDITPRKQLEQERETVTAQLEALQAVTDTALTHLGLDDVLYAVLDRIHAVLGLEHAAIRLLDADGRMLGLPTARTQGNALASAFPLALGEGFAGRIAASREPLALDDLADFPFVNRALGARLRSAVGVPLLFDGRLLGVLYSGTTTTHHFTDHEVRLLQLLGERVAVAVDRMRLFEAERAARAEAERREEELDRVVEQMAEGVAIYDAQGMLVRSLSERMTLFAARDEHDCPLTPEDGPLPRALRGEGLRQAERMDIRVRTPDGRDVELSVSAATLRDKDGRLVGAVGIFQDQTERKQLEGERAEAHARELAAQQVAEQLEAFLAVAAHDIRSPVTVVSSQVQLARRRAGRLVEALAESPLAGSLTAPVLTPAVDAVVESLVAAEAGVERMRRLVAQLFDVVRARSETLAVELAPCDLTALVQKNAAAQQATVPERRIELEVLETMVLVEADADRLDQVLSNYLTNALKYSPAEQPVTVKLEVVEHQAVVSVADHGPGLPRKEQSRIWELFHRVPGIEVQSGSGQASGSLGLGLYICKQLVELHPGGSVGVESMVGAGSTFWFRLPLASSS